MKLDCRRCGAPIAIPTEATQSPTATLVCPGCGARYARRASTTTSAARMTEAAPSLNTSPAPAPGPAAPLPSLAQPISPTSAPASHPTLAMPAADATQFAPGDLVAARYRVRRFIARGGMGEVYEAEDAELRQTVALKTVHPRRGATRARRRALQARDPSGAPRDAPQRLPDLRRRVPHDGGRRSRDLPFDGAPRRRDAGPAAQAGRSARHRRGAAARRPDDGRARSPPTPPASSIAISRARTYSSCRLRTRRGSSSPTSASRAVSSSTSSRPASTVADVAVGTPAYMAPEQIEGTAITPRSTSTPLASSSSRRSPAACRSPATRRSRPRSSA